MTTVHACSNDALGNNDAVGVAARIASGEISKSEATTAAIERALATNEEIAAIVCDRYDKAQSEANGTVIASTSSSHSVAAGGAFDGVPMFVKDQLHIAGLPTKYGSKAFDNAKVRTNTDAPIAQMQDMGMIALGKSTLPEFGLTSTTESPHLRPTRNPWNTNHTAGGSSGGAGALVAAGVVPIAHSADGGGSTRIPASVCGLVGLKPTRERLIPVVGAPKLPVNLISNGVVTRSVRDTALYFSEAEARYKNPQLPSIGHVTEPVARSLRIGVTTESPAVGSIDNTVNRVFNETVTLVESLGHKVEAISMPVDSQFGEDFELYWAMLAFSIKTSAHKITGDECDRSQFTPLLYGLANEFRRGISKLPGAIRRLRRSSALYDELFVDFDVIMTPTLGQIPPKIGHLALDIPFDVQFPRVREWVRYTPYANVTGAPSISLPMGHDAETELPIGMMFGARHGADRLLLELALQLEEARPFREITSV